MADYTPVYLPGQTWSATVSAAVTGGQLVAVSATGTIGPAGAASLAVVGVAAHDQLTVGGKVTVILNKVIHETVASGAITAGDNLLSAAGGLVATGAAAVGTRIGIALTTAANAALVRWVAV